MAERASEERLIDAPADRIMEVIVDYESYPDWADNIREVEVRQTDDEGRGTVVWYRVDARVMEITYSLAYEYPNEHRLTWTLHEADQLNALDGEYLLEPVDDGTRVQYTLEVDLAIPVPGFLKKRAAKQIMETSLGELKNRVESSS
ncbi:MAG: SRPBCC family protein [Actinobacteria bacterium]|nr:SRPBCC family protein [Actinomycetota bacterium]